VIDRIHAARAWYESRSQRDRTVLLAASLIAVLLAFEALAFGSARARLATVEARFDAVEQERRALETELETLDEQDALDPNAAVRRQLGLLGAEIAALDTKLGEQALQIIAPDEARLVLRDLIDNVAELDLRTMRTLTPEQLVNATADDLPALYRHGLVIDLEGEYLALLAYVRALEALPWRFYWLGMNVQAEAPGPRRFRLHIYTVSLRKEWIRV